MNEDKTSPENLDPTKSATPPDSGRPQRIGPYRLLQKIGEGGMGEVYEAEQETPVRRRVALKLIKPGMDSREVLARFEVERQALALMDHPNVAKVFDAGADDRGRPYFAMEFIRGVRITEHCDRQRLTTRERLELFRQVCAGVQHAHQKGIIHRDIKPSNILVQVRDGERIPKIIDFGVAKATAQRLTERTLFTERGVLIGTPAYMSPEQAEMTAEDVDTRTDVYSLGVLLYELLVGALPLDPSELKQTGFDEIRRRIRVDEPSKPSTRVNAPGDASTESARRRRTDLRTLRKQLSGDLDWITMRALEKDRARRYGTPSDLAEDIRRHLCDEPVLAGPPSTVYRMRKFVRRHRVGVAAASLVLIALLSGLGVATYGLLRATHAEEEARRDAATSEQVSKFLTGLFEVSDPGEARGNTITAREILDEGAGKIRSELRDQPLIQARLMSTMGEVYENLGLYEQARPLLEEALRSQRNLLGAEHIDVAGSSNKLGGLLWRTGDYAEAKLHLDRALAIREKVLGPEHLDVASSLNDIGILLWQTRDYAGARSVLKRALAIREEVLGPQHPDVAQCLNNLANISHGTGDFPAAREQYERVLAIWRQTLGPDHIEVARSLDNLGVVLQQMGDYSGAQAYHERALAIFEKILGPDHPEVAVCLGNLADLYRKQGRFDKAEPLFLRTLATTERRLGNNHSSTGIAVHNLACIYRDTGRHNESRQLFERAQRNWEDNLGPNHPYVIENLEQYAKLLRKMGEDEEAASLEIRAKAIREILAEKID